jgi:hypothetical protein
MVDTGFVKDVLADLRTLFIPEVRNDERFNLKFRALLAHRKAVVAADESKRATCEVGIIDIIEEIVYSIIHIDETPELQTFWGLFCLQANINDLRFYYRQCGNNEQARKLMYSCMELAIHEPLLV